MDMASIVLALSGGDLSSSFEDFAPIITGGATIIQAIATIAAGGPITWAITATLVVALLGLYLWLKSIWNGWVNLANEKQKAQAIADAKIDNQNASDNAGSAVSRIEDAAKAHPDTDKPAVPRQP